jgi:hypothetical protein
MDYKSDVKSKYLARAVKADNFWKIEDYYDPIHRVVIGVGYSEHEAWKDAYSRIHKMLGDGE